jgi:4-amino-4-deoxy-L-arabinose transferase-like glycosyltransferase
MMRFTQELFSVEKRAQLMRTVFWIAAAGILLAGLAIRLVDLSDPPLDFHAPRQIHSALIARGYYAQLSPDLDIDLRGRMVALGVTETWIEPPIVETFTALAWKTTGQDDLSIPRLFSILFWLVGGVPLLLLARRSAGALPALAALTFYLLLPYGVISSRSFQPDPFMVCLMLFAAWAGVRWMEKPGWVRALLAGLLVGAAILVKQVAVFPMAGLYAGLVLAKMGLRRGLKDRQTWAVAGLAVLPAGIYNIYGIWVAGFLAGQYNQRFFPELWLDPGFYLRWALQVDHTIGLAGVLLSLVGIGMMTRGFLRGMLTGWLAGYLIYGLVFAHHISTHDYYQLPLIPLAALGLAPVAWLVVERVRKIKGGWFTCALVSVAFVGAGLFAAYQARAELRRVDYRAEPAIWQGLGERMAYESWKVIGLFPDYGARMMYWSLITPAIWLPTVDQKEGDASNLKKWQDEFYRLTEGKVYFVVADLEEFDRQPELKKMLEGNYPVIVREKGILVFDLQSKRE